MYKILTHFVFWFLGAAGLYYLYISSMAQSLGIPNRPLTQADYIEGLSLSLVAAAALSVISLTVSASISKIKKQHTR